MARYILFCIQAVSICVTASAQTHTNWTFHGIEVYGGKSSTIMSARYYGNYLTKVAANKETLDKLYLDCGNPDYPTNEEGFIISKTGQNFGISAVIRNKRPKGNFISAYEWRGGIGYTSATTQLKYTSSSGNKTQSSIYESYYKLHFEEITITTGFALYTNIYKKIRLFTGISPYISVLPISSKISTTATLMDKIYINNDGSPGFRTDNILVYAASTDFHKQWSTIGFKLPLGAEIELAEHSDLFTQINLDFNWRTFTFRNTIGDVYFGWSAGYRCRF